MEGTEHHLGPFYEKDFGAISGGPLFSRPLCFTADPNSLCRTSVLPVILKELFSWEGRYHGSGNDYTINSPTIIDV